MKRNFWSALLVLLVVLALAACGGTAPADEVGDEAEPAVEDVVEEEPEAVEEEAEVVEEEAEVVEEEAEVVEEEVAAEGEAFVGNCEVSGPLRLWNWSEYMDPELMTEFGETYGVEVTEDNYSSNEELIARLRAGNSGYDLVFPSDYAVDILANEGLLAELDRENVPNFENLDPNLTGLYYDEENAYSVPFQWGTTGIAFNTNYVDEPDSWAVLFDPAVTEENQAFFSMLDDERETIGAALKYLGYSVNDTDPAHIEEAKEVLLQQKEDPYFSAYNSDNFNQTLASEEVYLAHAWSGGAALAASENEAIRYVIPQEGGVIWMDNMAIPADAPNRCTAELFINYILEPSRAARLSDYTYYNTPVPAAQEMLDPFTQELLSHGFVPDEETMGRLEWIERAGDTTIFSDAWTEIKAR